MILNYRNKAPVIDVTSYVAESAALIGEVYIGKYSSIWFSVVLRGDLNCISIGDYTSVQDGTVIHVTEILPTKVGNYVTIGHGTILHGCIIEDLALIGSGANILDEVVIGKNSIIAAGTVVAPRTLIPANSMVMGVPGKVVRKITEKEISALKEHAESYVKLAKKYKENNNKDNVY
ncbi:MAG TPA: gamma carbonic anhydrase family protein [Atribacterota bacterium]|nr:gamma carbonic anhydrase family protein [Atribacterota bacterium]HPK87233.1 gamma carbonic anhydrase family protein [Atribacterota bacterium]